MTTTQVTQTDTVRGVGGSVFAGTLMIIGGFFWAFEGLAGVVNGGFFRPVADYYTISGTTWGWVHLVLGILVLIAGFAVIAGQTWARILGIILVSISAGLNFIFIPWAPFWALTIIAIDIWVIYALSVYRPTNRSITSDTD